MDSAGEEMDVAMAQHQLRGPLATVGVWLAVVEEECTCVAAKDPLREAREACHVAFGLAHGMSSLRRIIDEAEPSKHDDSHHGTAAVRDLSRALARASVRLCAARRRCTCKVAKGVARARAACDMAIGLLGNVDAMLRIRLGSYQAVVEVTSPAELITIIRHVVGTFRTRAGVGRSIVVNITEPTHELVIDQRLVWQALWNVVDNAVLYGYEDAPIVVSSGTPQRELALSVQSRGLPIAGDGVSRMNQPYHRTAAAMQVAPAHLGVGLFVAARAMHAMGGSLSMEASGDVTTVRLLLPDTEALDANPPA